MVKCIEWHLNTQLTGEHFDIFLFGISFAFIPTEIQFQTEKLVGLAKILGIYLKRSTELLLDIFFSRLKI